MKVTKIYEPLYKLDTSENIRIWYMELGESEGEAGYRTVSGIRDGNLVTSDWHKCEPKNVGKKNSTNPLTQAKKEIKANYKSKKDSGYFEDIDNINTHTKFVPMLANKYENEKFNFDITEERIYSQPKLDGIRCIARSDGLWTREGKEITAVPHIWNQIKNVFVDHPNLTFDGELYNHDLKDDFNQITSIVRKTKLTTSDFENSERMIQYHVYDVIDCLDEKICFGDRRKKFFPLLNFPSIVKVETHLVMDKEHLNALYENYLENGYEGQMIRRNLSYEHKRSHNLVKRKEFMTEEFKVLSVEEGKGNWHGKAKRFICETNDGKRFGSGVRGKAQVLQKLFKSIEKPKWATIRFFNYTPDGVPRFPVAIDWGYEDRRTD